LHPAVRAVLLAAALTPLCHGGGRPGFGVAAARAASPYLEVPPAEVVDTSPAYRYANLTDEQAFAELDLRNVGYKRVAPVGGVRAPIRLTGPLHGVRIHSSLPEAERAHSPFEILDARLALALDDFAALLERHDVDELVHYTMYRPNVPKEPPRLETSDHSEAGTTRATGPAARELGKDPPRAKGGRELVGKRSAARKQKNATANEPKAPRKRGAAAAPRPGARPKGAAAKKPADANKPEERSAARGRWAPPGTRHPAGLAIDVAAVHKRDGRWLSVASHFQGRIGARTCGPGARTPQSAEARELWSIVCEAAELGLFTYVLTPNYDAAHADHFHMEIKPAVRWFLYH
jgi:hypothetical protein